MINKKRIKCCLACTDKTNGGFIRNPVNGYQLEVKPWDCKSRFVVYVVRCRQCHVFYVGETTTTITVRFEHHRCGDGLTALLEHFDQVHPDTEIYKKIQIYIVSDPIRTRRLRVDMQDAIAEEMRMNNLAVLNKRK